MVAQLSGLISDTVKRPLILNGKLVTKDNVPLRVKMGAGYHIVFTTTSAGKKEEATFTEEEGEKMLTDAAVAFIDKYGAIGSDTSASWAGFQANIDPFTQAIVLKNNLYDILRDKYSERHLHDGTSQFPPAVQSLISAFVEEQIVNYFEVYINLINRRLMSGHMPTIVKGHLIAGLYQPLLVQTKHIDCPLMFGEFDWFLNYLNKPTQTVEYLGHQQETNRGLDLSVIAMSDLRERLKTPIVRDMDRNHWMFILYSTLSRYILGGESLLMRRYGRIYDTIVEGRGVAEGTPQFYFDFFEGVKKIQTDIAVR